jgi:hypothetical protein
MLYAVIIITSYDCLVTTKLNNYINLNDFQKRHNKKKHLLNPKRLIINNTTVKSNSDFVNAKKLFLLFKKHPY